ncbi:MAG: spermidine/putrescine ABC transporter substrate-binding protein [Oscillospiraceae bacterium]|nr:spermidine/putrescine ABC transporter substrate-binding protein [Oscillospiraceae bacterium]
MPKNKVKAISVVFAAAFLCISVTSCSSVETEDSDDDETAEVQTLTIEDDDYYSRFRNDGISINVYNWGEYISDGSEEGTLNVNAEFTKLTGIKVNYTNYATNEELYAKLKGGGASYDIIIPSDYMISRMIKEGMIQKLDYDNIPNFKYITDIFVNPAYDPENEYTVPYTWGTVGIIYDTTLVDIPADEIDWDILWNEDYADRILMFDNPRDAFAIAELRLGYSMNTENPDQLEDCAKLLKEQKKVVQAYVMDEIFDKMGAGEALAAPYYAGDAITLMDEYEDLGFVIPKSGTNLFIDAMCIPIGAKQKEAAEMYINFMCEPDIAYATTTYIGYSTPNDAAYEMLDDEIKNDGISYLDNDYLNENTTIYCNLSDEANQKLQDLWTELKSTQDETKNKWLVPIFLLACVLTSIGILIRRYIKSKKDMF